MGWVDQWEGTSWLLRPWENSRDKDTYREWLEGSDAVIFPAFWASPKVLSGIRWRLNKDRLCVSYSERRFKKPVSLLSFHYHLIRPLAQAWSMNSRHLHYFAIGTYAAWDQHRIGMFRRRMWRFGYFCDVPPLSLTDAGKTGGDLKIVWAGAMRRWKSLHVLIEAVAQVQQVNSRFQLNLIGGGPEEPMLRELVSKHGLDGRVAFLGVRPPREVQELLASSDLLVLPSGFEEGWGMVVNEAMAASCAVIASKQAGATESLVEEGITGFQFEVNDIEGLARKLLFCIDNPEKVHQMGIEGRRRLSNTWSPQYAAERVVSLLIGILGRSPMPNYTEGVCSPAAIVKDNRKRSFPVIAREVLSRRPDKYTVEW